MEKTQDSCLAGLSKETWFGIWDLYQWKGFWLTPDFLESTMAIQAHFEPHPHDIILCSFPKTGTTWLKAILFSISVLNSRDRGLIGDDPLLTHNPHDLIPQLEFTISTIVETPIPSGSRSPRLFGTHLPYGLLPESVKNSGCRIIYVTRNPRDTFVSSWHFMNTVTPKPFPFEEGFESFCRGVSPFGPFFDHALGYWKEKEKVHFVRYEDIQDDPRKQVKELAEFLGYTLDYGEEMEDIIGRCSHERLSNLEVNKNFETIRISGFPNGSFFRRGVVGDWRNHFTEEMIDRLDGIARQKLEGSGLSFKVDLN